MDDIRISLKQKKDRIEITVDDLFFLISLKYKKSKSISDTTKLYRKINKIYKDANIFLNQDKKNEYLYLRKKLVKIAVNHVLGMSAFSRLYKKYNDLAIVESIAKAINQQIIYICNEISKKDGGGNLWQMEE